MQATSRSFSAKLPESIFVAIGRSLAEWKQQTGHDQNRETVSTLFLSSDALPDKICHISLALTSAITVNAKFYYSLIWRSLAIGPS
jgi:hypothetical protein